MSEIKLYNVRHCKQCSSGFESKRSTALYCSAKCRKLAFQLGAKNAKGENAKTRSGTRFMGSIPDEYIEVMTEENKKSN